MRPLFQRAFVLAALLVAPAIALLAAPLCGECVVKRTVGFACPGCGLGHALDAVRRLDVAGALASYPPLALLAAGWVVALVACARWLVAARRRSAARRSDRVRRAGAVVGVACAAVIVCNWIITLCVRGG